MHFRFYRIILVYDKLRLWIKNEFRLHFDQRYSKRTNIDKKAFDIFEKKREIWEFIKTKLVTAQEFQKLQTDKTRNDSSDYKVINFVWLFIKIIKTSRSFKKLNHIIIDFYKVLKILKKNLLTRSSLVHENLQ